MTIKEYIHCPVCRGHLSIERQGQAYVLVENAAIQAREALQKSRTAKARALVASLEATSLLNEFKNLLNGQPSAAARLRLLKSHGLASGTVETFRRNWPGTDRWIESDSYGSNLSKIMGVLGKSEPAIETFLREPRIID